MPGPTTDRNIRTFLRNCRSRVRFVRPAIDSMVLLNGYESPPESAGSRNPRRRSTRTGTEKRLRKVTKYQALVKAVQLTLIPLVSLCSPLNSDDGRHRPAVAPIINFRMSCEVL